MPPIRRYLRISKYSVLECRIFLENPADGPRWLLNPGDPALPRIFEAVKPLVLPKLKEENERAKGKGKKKKSVKDVITKDDFEVSVFLTDVSVKHNLVVKDKTFDEGKDAQGSNTRANPVVLREDSDDASDLARIPQAQDDEEGVVVTGHVLGRVQEDDKKKLGLKTTYSGFAIWGKVLCLLVERKGGPGKKSSSSVDGGGQALMQDWITTSQLQHEDQE